MHKAKVTTPKLVQESSTNNNNGSVVGESFRILYYGSASAGSVPFMWESQPGTPKHALTESSLPPLTPPPSYNQSNQKYNSPMHVTNSHSPKGSGFFRTLFMEKNIVRKNPSPSSFSSSSLSSSSSSGSSRLRTLQSTPMSKTELRQVMKLGFEDGYDEEERDGDSQTSTLCFGPKSESMKSYRIKKIKKAMISFVRNGKA